MSSARQKQLERAVIDAAIAYYEASSTPGLSALSLGKAHWGVLTAASALWSFLDEQQQSPKGASDAKL